jgi:hypothetical protein
MLWRVEVRESGAMLVRRLNLSGERDNDACVEGMLANQLRINLVEKITHRTVVNIFETTVCGLVLLRPRPIKIRSSCFGPNILLAPITHPHASTLEIFEIRTTNSKYTVFWIVSSKVM